MGLDSFLARVCRRTPSHDFLAREVQKGAAFVFDSAAGVALLDGVRGTSLAPAAAWCFVLRTLGDEEALIEKCIPQDIARGQPDGRNEVVLE
jgi:hypothetical protein